jgi:FMN reductase
MSIVFISGSPSNQSRSAHLLELLRQRLAASGEPSSLIRVADLPAEALLHARFDDPAILAANEQVAAARAVVIATPIYKAAYSGVLKAFLDLLPQDGFTHKIVLPIATAGSLAHVLAVDYALRPVIAALGAREILAGVVAIEQQLKWTPERSLLLDAEVEQRLERAVEGLIERLQRARHDDLRRRQTEAEPVHFSTLRYSA